MPEPRRVAIMLDLEWPYKRHTGVFVGRSAYAQEHGWKSLVDEYVAETLAAHPDEPAPYDGVIARATLKLARRAARRNVPLVNVWLSSPAWKTLPGVFSDYAAGGRLRRTPAGAGLPPLRSPDQRKRPSAAGRVAGVFFARWRQRAVPALPPRWRSPHASSLKQWRTTERTIAAWMKDWQLPIGVYIGSEPDGRMVEQICYNRGWRCRRTWRSSPAATRKHFASTSTDAHQHRVGLRANRVRSGAFAGRTHGRRSRRRRRRCCFRRRASLSASPPISSPSTTH